MDRLEALRRMMLIRRFEERLMERPDHGFQLLSSGEEAVAVGLCGELAPGDQLLCSGRSIGPALARGLDSAQVMAEILGKVTGPNQGRGGRGHLSQPSMGFFGAHGVVGGNLTIAAGAALAAQMATRDKIVVCIFGDGACGSGTLHETMNIAASWRLPLLLVCNNNGLAVSTPVERAIAARPLSSLANPFKIPSATVDGLDVESVAEAAERFVAHVRSGAGPAFLECRSERLASHSSAARDTRAKAELARLRGKCPILALERRLVAEGEIGSEGLLRMRREVDAEMDKALKSADEAAWPDPETALVDV